MKTTHYCAKDLSSVHSLTDTKSAISVKFNTKQNRTVKGDISFRVECNSLSFVEIYLNFDVQNAELNVDIRRSDNTNICNFDYTYPQTLCCLTNGPLFVNIYLQNRQKSSRLTINKIITREISYDTVQRLNNETLSECANPYELIEKITYRNIAPFCIEYVIYCTIHNISLAEDMIWYCVENYPVVESERSAGSEGSEGSDILCKIRALKNEISVLSDITDTNKLRFLKDLEEALLKELETVRNLISQYAMPPPTSAPTLDLASKRATLSNYYNDLFVDLRKYAGKIILN